MRLKRVRVSGHLHVDNERGWWLVRRREWERERQRPGEDDRGVVRRERRDESLSVIYTSSLASSLLLVKPPLPLCRTKGDWYRSNLKGQRKRWNNGGPQLVKANSLRHTKIRARAARPALFGLCHLLSRPKSSSLLPLLPLSLRSNQQYWLIAQLT